MRKFHVGLLLALCALAAVIWSGQLARWLRPVPNLTRYPLGPRFYCETCGWHFDDSPRLLPPLNCPKCKQPSAMRTLFGPSAAAPEFIQCKKCQARIPLQLFKWPPEEKRRWEKRLSELHDGEFLTSAEMSELQKTKMVKTSASDWMPWDDYARRPSAEMTRMRCVRCGNTNETDFGYVVEPPGTTSGR